MNTYRPSKLFILILIGALPGLLYSGMVSADRGDRDRNWTPRYQQNDDRGRDQRQDKDQRNVVPRPPRSDVRRGDIRRSDARQPTFIERDRNARTPSRTAPPPRDYALDPKYHHDRYYPPRGYVAPRLPRAYRELTHNHVRYYYHSGVWYRRSVTGFIVVVPPIGVAIPVLPPFYTTIWVGSVPYYYANGIYYVWYPAVQAYVVSSPPPESAISEKPTEAQKLFIYPKQGQSEEQQAKDRYQCHRWALDKTGFDPTRAGGNVPAADYFTKREDYQRAIKACLEARGYSVQ